MSRPRRKGDLIPMESMLPGFQWPTCASCGKRCHRVDLIDGRCLDCSGQNGPTLLQEMTA